MARQQGLSENNARRIEESNFIIRG